MTNVVNLSVLCSFLKNRYPDIDAESFTFELDDFVQTQTKTPLVSEFETTVLVPRLLRKSHVRKLTGLSDMDISRKVNNGTFRALKFSPAKQSTVLFLATELFQDLEKLRYIPESKGGEA